jgi:hypothetical protein
LAVLSEELHRNSKSFITQLIERHLKNDFFFKNEITTQQKINQIPDFYKRYYVFKNFSPIKIGEFNKEQKHLENYEDLSNKLNVSETYAVVTYPFLNPDFYTDFDTFFSPLIRFQNQTTNPKTFFHYFFSSYIHLVESILLLNEKNIYPFLIKEETIFFNREKMAILSLPLTFSLSSNISIDELLIFMNHLSVKDLSFLPIEFYNFFLFEREKKSHKNPDFYIESKKTEKMANECILTIPNLNNYQLSLLYLKQLDKIMENKQISVQFIKFQKLINNLYVCFQNIMNTKSDKIENLRDTKEKIENLFLGFS